MVAVKRGNESILVSHTHWDREWYKPFQTFRGYMVEMVDRLIDLMEKNPDYKHFLLDGQSILLEDYFEVRPENKERIRALVSSGRLSVGPFYVLPDMFLVSAESIVRNLLLGIMTAERYGGAQKIGYQPDCFGQIAQTPQIMKGFDFKGFVFWRGLGDEMDFLPTTFLWEAPSGDRILTHQIAIGYFNVGDLPQDTDAAITLIEKTKSMLQERSNRNFQLLLNGHDHAFPQGNVPQIIKAYNKKHPDEPIRHGSLQDFFNQLEENTHDLPVYRGEFRGARLFPVLPGVLSSRIYLKQANHRCQTKLENYAEPFSTWAWLLGENYDRSYLWLAWKWLLENHPHDSICGCSIDQVHREMETRFAWSEQIADLLTLKAMERIASKATVSGEGFPIAVFNPSPWKRTGVVEFLSEPFPPFTFNSQQFTFNPSLLWSLDFKPDRNFCVVDQEGRSLPVELFEEPENYAFRFFENMTRYTLRFLATDVPACGYKILYIKEGKAENVNSPLKVNVRERIAENEHLRVKFNPNGTMDVTELSSGVTFTGLHMFEDVGDNGDEYNYSQLKEDEIITSENLDAEISFVEHPARVDAIVKVEMLLPKSLEEDNRNRRSRERIPLRITSIISLFPGSKFVNCKTEIENIVKDHRLRVLFPTGIKSDVVYADGHFGVVERSLKLPDDTNWIEVQTTANHQNLFVDINNGKKGLAIANKGLPEYEIYGENERTIAITLVRSVGWLSRNIDHNNRKIFGGPAIPTPEAQCQRRLTVEYAVIPHPGDWDEAMIPRIAREFTCDLKAVEVKNPLHKLPASISFLEVEPSSIILSAVKKAEKEEALIIRIYNTGKKQQNAVLTLGKPVKSAKIINLAEDELKEEASISIKENKITIESIPPAKIVTLKIHTAD
ncbi:MAG: glycoside hydrolase family 38 C-terminal domain-containing protein [Candidatus Jordarchaeaceae archaeon]